jgi:hypothetical protein
MNEAESVRTDGDAIAVAQPGRDRNAAAIHQGPVPAVEVVQVAGASVSELNHGVSAGNGLIGQCDAIVRTAADAARRARLDSAFPLFLPDTDDQVCRGYTPVSMKSIVVGEPLPMVLKFNLFNRILADFYNGCNSETFTERIQHLAWPLQGCLSAIAAKTAPVMQAACLIASPVA